MLSQLKQWRQKTKTNTVCPFNWNHRQLLRHRKFWPHFSCLLAVLCSYLSHISKTHELTVFTNHCLKLFMFCVKKKKKKSVSRKPKHHFPSLPAPCSHSSLRLWWLTAWRDIESSPPSFPFPAGFARFYIGGLVCGNISLPDELHNADMKSA